MTDELREMEPRPATRCARCGGVLVPSSGGPDVGDCCLACGRPSRPPLKPLALVRVEPEAARPDRTAPLKDQILALLRERGPLRRSALFTSVSDGQPGRPKSSELSATLAELRQLGLVDVRNVGERRTIWFLCADGAEPEEVGE